MIGLSYEAESVVGTHIRSDKTPYIIGAGTQKTNDAYGVKGFPSAFVIDPAGKIVFIGHPADPKFKQSILDTLKKSPPKLDGPALAAIKKADELFQKKDYVKALAAYEAVAKDYAGTPSGKKAKAKVKSINEDKTIAAAIHEGEAKKKCSAWLQMARGLAKNGKTEQARKKYQQIIDEFGDTTYAETAREEMAQL